MSKLDRMGIAVDCAVCGQCKQPIGRDAPRGSYYCDRDCEGYMQPPYVGSLWPGERKSQFGFPCSDVGTKECPWEIECPCCGDVGAMSDEHGAFYDGQPLVCGCAGWVSLDIESGPDIVIGDDPCPPTARCGGTEAL